MQFKKRTSVKICQTDFFANLTYVYETEKHYGPFIPTKPIVVNSKPCVFMYAL